MRLAIAVVLAFLLLGVGSVIVTQVTGSPSGQTTVSLEARVDILEERAQVKGIMVAYRGPGGSIGRLETVFDALIVPAPSQTSLTSTIAFYYRSAPGASQVFLPATLRLEDSGRRLVTVLSVPEGLLGSGERFYLEVTSEDSRVALMELDLPGELATLNLIPYSATLH